MCPLYACLVLCLWWDDLVTTRHVVTCEVEVISAVIWYFRTRCGGFWLMCDCISALHTPVDIPSPLPMWKTSISIYLVGVLNALRIDRTGVGSRRGEMRCACRISGPGSRQLTLQPRRPQVTLTGEIRNLHTVDCEARLMYGMVWVWICDGEAAYLAIASWWENKRSHGQCVRLQFGFRLGKLHYFTFCLLNPLVMLCKAVLVLVSKFHQWWDGGEALHFLIWNFRFQIKDEKLLEGLWNEISNFQTGTYKPLVGLMKLNFWSYSLWSLSAVFPMIHRCSDNKVSISKFIGRIVDILIVGRLRCHPYLLSLRCWIRWV